MPPAARKPTSSAHWLPLSCQARGQRRPKRGGCHRPDHPIPSPPTRSLCSNPRSGETDAADQHVLGANHIIATSSGECDGLEKAKVNWGHLAIAQLMSAGFIERVLTV